MIVWLLMPFAPILSAAPLPAPAAIIDISSGPLSLASVAELAQEDNPGLKSARQAWLAAAQIPAQASAFDDPALNVSHMLTGMRTAPQTMAGPMGDQITITQNIPFWDKRALRGQAASMNAEIARQAFRAKSLEIMDETVRAYYGLYFLCATVDILNEQQSVLDRMARSASAKYAAGHAPESEALRAQVELAKLENDLVTAQEQIKSAQARLNAVLDRPALAPLGRPQRPKPPEFPWDYQALARQALAQRPEILALEAAKGARKAQRRLAVERYFPDFMLGYQYGQIGSGTDLSYNGDDAQSLVVGLNIPLWLAKNRAAVKESRANLRAASFNVDDMLNQTRYDVENLAVEADTAARLFKLYRNVVLPQAQAALDSTQSAYDGGRENFLNLLDSERSLLAFELEQERHRVDFEIAVADLERVAGGALPAPAALSGEKQ